MSEAVSRAGFNVRHLRHGQSGTSTDRASLLHESMRELDSRAAAYYAANNPNIVAADTALNVAMVNDGAGGFRRAKATKEVLDYGDARIGTQQNPKDEDRVGNTGRIWHPRSFETTLIVTALPKSLCKEIPGVYPILDDETGEPVLRADGTPLMRSRWVARDRDEALEYFARAAEFLGANAFNGGQAAIHGYDVNFDEAYPHMQLMADTLAPDPKKPGQLRVEAQQMWGVHATVTDPETGKVEQPKAKMSRYQREMREHMIGLGYDVEKDASPRGPSSHGREEWAEMQNRERIAEALAEDAAKDRTKVAGWSERLGRFSDELDAQREELSELREGARAEGRDEGLRQAADEAVEIKRRARVEGHREGREEGLREAEQQAAEAMRLADADRAEAARAKDAARAAQQAALRSREETEELREQLAAEVARLEQEPPDFKLFLDTPLRDGRTVRPMFNKVLAPIREKRARSAQLLDEVRNEAARGREAELGG